MPSVLAERYAIERELGSGGMATVYLARDTKHDRRVAVKVMRPEVAASLGAERFLREITIAASLTHPHIVPLHDSGADGDLLYYVMSYIEGESLRDRLVREKLLPVEESLRLAREVADALAHAHALGIVHRDIKPENILLAGGHALVADFGIAVAVSAAEQHRRITQTGMAVGTPMYMSPEQASGETQLDGRSDVYSLACVLYEMLAGEPPYTGPTAQAVFARRMIDSIPSLSAVRDTVPEHVEHAIRRALSRAAADRFATAAAFADALARPAAAAKPRSVAVLPFVNLSADPENEYFADGITEDVIAHVAKIGTLQVISRTSVMPFKGHDQSLKDIAARLKVATVLEGSVRRAGDRVRIVAQLIDAATDQHLWAETYDRQLTDIFAIQTDVAIQIAGALKAGLSSEERTRIAKEPTQDVQAYQLYLQGRHCYIRYTPDGMRQGIDYYQQALARDPGFAQAHAGIALASLELDETGLESSVGLYEQARRAAERAVSLDETLADAHVALAYLRMVFEFDWTGSESAFKRALELSPNHADAHDHYGRLCAALGRNDEALALQQRAQELDPLSHPVDVATALLRVGRLEEALDRVTQAIAFRPDYGRALATRGWILLKLGRNAEGIASLERAVAVAPGETQWLAQLGQACAQSGQIDRARQILQQLEERSRTGFVAPYHFAYVCAGLGEQERAMDYLEQAFEQRSGAVYNLKGSFLFAPLRQHPRFVALLTRLHLD